jgi:lysyl-tRNA synthetase, class II
MSAAEPVDPWEVTPCPGSSNIAEFRFDKTTDTMQVDFVSGDTYEYYNVSPATNRAFQAAPSKGEFFARSIRNRFPYEKL